ncbi:MAG: extracellular solute-binding protein [Desulfurococcales archaeon]|nr:extracellular solute-binding protein [Desulfurococcales archaeon]
MAGRRAISRSVAAVIVVVVIIVAGAAAWLASRGGGGGAATTSAGTAGGAAAAPPELTGNFTKDALAIGRWLEEHGVGQVTYTVMAAGDPNSVMRMYGIVEAAEDINDLWSENGVNVKITIKTDWSPDFKKQYDNFKSKYELGENGDFFVNSYIYIAPLASQGRLLDLTPWVQKYQGYFSDFFQTLMKAGQYQGKQYGIPQDTEARPLYIRKDVARCMGWDLRGLDEKVKNGQFTWQDVYQKAKEAVEKGCADWGLIHRKGSAHPDLIQFIFAFGGKLYDPQTGKLVVDKVAIKKWFQVEYQFARDGLLPRDIMSWDWGTQIHPTIVGERKADGGDGNTLFDIGGTWYWTEWQSKKYYLDPKTGERRPLTPEEVAEKFYYTLFPAGEPGKQPVTLSQPFMWMIAANAGKENPHYNDANYRKAYQELAFLIVVKASDPEINAIHSVISAHLPVSKKAANLLKDPQWVEKLRNHQLGLHQDVLSKIADIIDKTADPINIQFLANVTYMLDYTHFAPSHPLYDKLAGIFADAVDKVIRGEMTPDQGVDYIVQKVKADPDLSANVEIIG